MAKHSIDGFVPRRMGDQVGGNLSPLRPEQEPNRFYPKQPTRAAQESGSLNASSDAPVAQRPTLGGGSGVRKSDLDDSLKSIDDPDAGFGKKGKKKKAPLTRKKKIIKWSIIGVSAIILLLVGWLLFKIFLAGGNIFKGNLLDLAQSRPLKEDENGRSNIVIFGTAEDDEGGEHGGANLTDSIMVMSINQTKKDAYMISLPRDLYVTHDPICPGLGTNAGKLNETYFCDSSDGQNEEQGAAGLQEKAGEILGLDIQYYAHLNFTAVTEAVDAVGGIDVKIESEDPRGILDRNFDWKCNYQCYYVKYENGEEAHLDGEHALALARARNASGGYGLPNANFDREKNQQKIIKALREKAVSAGTLTDIGKVTGLIDAMGNNLRTNFETAEIRTLMGLGTDIQSDKINSISLVGEDVTLVENANMGGASIVQPVAGLYDYSQISEYIDRELNATPVTREGADVVVLNGSETPGAAQQEADKLTDAGLVVSGVDNAPEGSYGKATIYKVGDKELPATTEKLKSMYGVEPKSGTPPVTVTGDTDFVVIIGQSSSNN